MIEWVWLGREAAVVHAFAGVEPGIFERLALATGWRRKGGRRLARCGGEPAWLTRARGDEYLNGAPARPVVRADDAQGLELAERIARDVARRYAVADRHRAVRARARPLAGRRAGAAAPVHVPR